MKKFKIFLIVFAIILIFSIGGSILFINKDKIILKSNVFTFEYGEKICSNVKCYLKDEKNIDNYTLDIGNLKIKENGLVSQNLEQLNVGEYDLIINYKQQSKKIKIKVLDTTPPEFVKITDKIVLEQNSIDVDLSTYFSISDLSDCDIKYDATYDITKLGEYNVKIIAVDKYDNKNTKEVIVEIVDLESAKKDGIITKNLDGKVYKSAAMLEYEKNKDKEQSKNTSVSKPSDSSDNKNQSSNKSTNSNNNVNTPQSVSPRYRKDISDSYVAQINAYRSSQGLSVLPVTSEAQAEADRRAKEIVTNPSHEGSSYGFGENIGGGAIGTDFFKLWMNSHAHYNAIIREQNVAIASSVYEIDGMWYAVVVFRMNY